LRGLFKALVLGRELPQHNLNYVQGVDHTLEILFVTHAFAPESRRNVTSAFLN
jgi:hypothetical protein